MHCLEHRQCCGSLSAASGSSSATAATSGHPGRPTGIFTAFRGWRLGPQDFDALRATGKVIIWSFVEVRIVRLAAEVAVGQLGADGQPARSDGHVPSEDVQTSPAQAEVLDDVENLFGLLDSAEFGLFRDDEIDVDVGVDEVAVCAAPHGALNTHQTVLLGPLEHGARLQVLQVNRVLDVSLDPANVLAPAEAPLAQALSAQVQAVRGTAPEEEEGTRRGNFLNF